MGAIQGSGRLHSGTVTWHVQQIGREDRERYEGFLDSLGSCEQLTFYHAWEWGEVLAARTGPVTRVAVEHEGELVAVGQVALHHDHRVRYWYAPRGLAMDHAEPDRVTGAYSALRDHFRGRDGAAFLRVDPTVVRGDPAEAAIDAAGAKKAAIFTQAERVWVAEVQPTPEEQIEWLRAHGLKGNTRRAVNKARNAGVTVRASDDPQDLETLICMLGELDARKGGIGKHDDDHYRAQFAQMAPAGHQKLFLAEMEGRVGAVSLMAIYGGEASFLHGASSAEPTFRKLSPSYLLHPEAMAWLAEHRPEVTRYNFWGIVSEVNRHPGHPRHGYSEFKRSFGGYQVEYIRAREFVYQPVRRSALYLLETYRTKRYQND